MACLDTGAILDLVGRGSRQAQADVYKRLQALQSTQEELTTTRLNVAELWVGIFRSRDPQREQQRIEKVLSGLTILEHDELSAQLFGEIKAHLLDIGRPVGDTDTLIAAVARANGHSLLTRNAAHFQNVPGLTVLTY
jgi:tRNA(fMet)-specific endonuclease VapC